MSVPVSPLTQSEQSTPAPAENSAIDLYSPGDVPQRSTGRWYRLSRPRGSGYATPDFSRACLIRLIDYPEMPLRTNTHETIKAGRSTLLVRTELPFNGDLHAAAYKRIRRNGWLKKLTALPRLNRALRTWRLGHELRARGVSTPRPLAIVIPRRHRVQGATFTAQEWIDGARNLHAYCQWASALEGYRSRRKLHLAAEALGRLVGRMHAAGVSHRDLKPANLLLVDRPEGCDAYVIDLDGARLHRHVSARRRAKNLARLARGQEQCPGVTATAILRFLKAFLRETGHGEQYWKALWSDVARRQRRLAALKKGRWTGPVG